MEFLKGDEVGHAVCIGMRRVQEKGTVCMAKKTWTMIDVDIHFPILIVGLYLRDSY